MRKIGGRFRIVADSEAVSHVLRLTGVYQILHDDGPADVPKVSQAERSDEVECQGMTLQVFARAGNWRDERLELIGDPTRLVSRGYDAARRAKLAGGPGRGCSGIRRSDRASRLAADGLGSSWRSRAMRPIGRAGARAARFRARGRRVRARGARPVRAGILDGTRDRGRFEAKGEPESGSVSVPLSQIAQACLDQAGGGTVGVVIAGESDGLVGAAFLHSPVGVAAGGDPFSHPEVATRSRSTPEPEHRRGTAIVVGVATEFSAARGSNHSCGRSRGQPTLSSWAISTRQ